MMAAMAGIIFQEEYPEEYQPIKTAKRELTPEELEEIKKAYKEKEIERKKKRGLKEWDINGVRVIALNKKNAIRKYKNFIKRLNNLDN